MRLARHPHSIPLGGFLARTGFDLAPFCNTRIKDA
jgi:hypothetical protein